MKSYKDLDREIILNTPEGAMWVAHAKDEDDTNMYYKVKNGRLLVNCYASWGTSSNNSIAQAVLRESGFEFIPLPNIEIPWEATADSVCPVPDGCEVKVTLNTGYTITDDDPEGWTWSTISAPIMAYKIIDEDYLLGVVTVPQALVDHCKSLVEGVKVDLEQPLPNPEDQLIDKLKFLQNLANQFPEIRDHSVKYMKEWLDYYVEDDVEGV